MYKYLLIATCLVILFAQPVSADVLYYENEARVGETVVVICNDTPDVTLLQGNASVVVEDYVVKVTGRSAGLCKLMVDNQIVEIVFVDVTYDLTIIGKPLTKIELYSNGKLTYVTYTDHNGYATISNLENKEYIVVIGNKPYFVIPSTTSVLQTANDGWRTLLSSDLFIALLLIALLIGVAIIVLTRPT